METYNEKTKLISKVIQSQSAQKLGYGLHEVKCNGKVVPVLKQAPRL